jgi:antitoxin component YwqK of YwqJK toxin-antitoxin module
MTSNTVVIDSIYHPNGDITTYTSLKNRNSIMVMHTAKTSHYTYLLVNGILAGEYMYYENDKLTLTCEYVNGKKHGREIRYYDNSNIHIITNWIEGLQNGYSAIYSKHGYILYYCEYKNGVKQSEVHFAHYTNNI